MEENYYPDYYQLEEKHWYFVGRRRIIFSLLEQIYPKGSENRKIIDIGCGTGIMQGYLAKYGNVSGIDNEDIALDYCRERGFTTVSKGDICCLEIPDATYDLVTAFDIVEHVADDHRAVSELARIVKPGGRILVTVPAFSWLWSNHDLINQHQRRYHRKSVEKLMAGAGLEIQKLTYFNSFFFPLIVSIRWWQKFFAPHAHQHDLVLPPPLLNSLLAYFFGSESIFLRYFNFPLGVSLLCLAQKP